MAGRFSASKIVHCSPQRFLTAPHARLSKCAADDGSSDAATTDEFVNAAGELEFGVIGVAGERVDVTIVTAEQSPIVLLLPVLLRANGSAEFHCGSTGATTLDTLRTWSDCIGMARTLGQERASVRASVISCPISGAATNAQR